VSISLQGLMSPSASGSGVPARGAHRRELPRGRRRAECKLLYIIPIAVQRTSDQIAVFVPFSLFGHLLASLSLGVLYIVQAAQEIFEVSPVVFFGPTHGLASRASIYEMSSRESRRRSGRGPREGAAIERPTALPSGQSERPAEPPSDDGLGREDPSYFPPDPMENYQLNSISR
jgi:hypothetical protein